MDSLIKRIAFKGRLFMERVQGVDFLMSATTEKLALSPEQAHGYSTSDHRYLDRVLKSLRIQPEDHIVDFGCGKGAALAYFARFPFRGIEGVELSSELIAIARKNMAKLGFKHVTLHHMDAAAFRDLDHIRFFYFNNPFPGNVMSDVLGNIEISLGRVPREAVIIYRNPKCHDVIAASGFFEKVAEYPTEKQFPIFVYRTMNGSSLDSSIIY